MKATMDTAGRLVIPRAIREQAGWSPGTPLEVRWQEGQIVIAPAPRPVTLVRKGRFVVALPQEAGPVLTMQTVEETRDAVVRDHEGRA